MAPKKSKAAVVEEKAGAGESAEPDAKKAKTEEEEEKEKDAPSDSRAAFKGSIAFEAAETTLNVVLTAGGRGLMTLTDGGMQYLLAGARANAGMRSGRYMYEVKVVESIAPTDGIQNFKQMARQTVRIGVSLAGSSLLLGADDMGLCFDSEGGFTSSKKRMPSAGARFGRGHTVALLVNLDAKSPNAHTVSLFVNGARACKPQPIPEEMKDKTLFPTVTYRNSTLQASFGPEPFRPLAAFKCRTLQSAANADIEKSSVKAPADGKYDVVFPVGYPEEGTFEWLDEFMAKNPHYTELSERKIIEWADQSGLHRKKSNHDSTDKPWWNFGLHLMDDYSAAKVINSIAPLVPRHYVVMEVKSNLIAAERIRNAKRFPSARFKKSCKVMLGEPTDGFKDAVKKKTLFKKQAALDAEFKKKKADQEKKRLLAARAKEMTEKRKSIEEQKKKAAEEAAAAKESEESAANKAEGEEKKKEETKMEEAPEESKKEDVEMKEESKEEAKEEAKVEVKEEVKEEEVQEAAEELIEPATATLTEEEESMWFSKPAVRDIVPQVMDSNFAQFSVPEKEEGFDVIDFEWQKEAPSKEYLKNKILERKRTCRIDSLQPTEFFKTQQADFTKKIAEWQEKQKTAKAAPKKKDDEEDEAAGIDLFSIEDVCDIGNGQPLFVHFTPEDWMLLTLRWELHLLATAIKKELDDPDRAAIPEPHVAFYYNKFFKRHLSTKLFGKDNLAELVTLAKDSVNMKGEPLMLSSALAEDAQAEMVCKLTEEGRRERQRRIDAGDETARLKFTAPPEPPKPEEPKVVTPAIPPAAAASATPAPSGVVPPPPPREVGAVVTPAVSTVTPPPPPVAPATVAPPPAPGVVAPPGAPKGGKDGAKSDGFKGGKDWNSKGEGGKDWSKGDGGKDWGKGNSGKDWNNGGKDKNNGGKDQSKGDGGKDWNNGGKDWNKGDGGKDWGKGDMSKGGKDWNAKGDKGKDWGKGGKDYGKDSGKGDKGGWGKDASKGDKGGWSKDGGKDFGKDFGKGGKDFGGKDWMKGGKDMGKGDKGYGKGKGKW